MKNKFFLFCFFCIMGFSQNYKGIKVHYKALLESIPIDPKNGSHNVLFEEINASLTNKSFLLQVNSKGFLFEEEIVMQQENEKKHTATITNIIFAINTYFYDKDRDKFFSVSNNLNVLSTADYKWEVTDESKKIDAYTSYKATCVYSFVSSKGKTVNRLITAWFTPEISFNYGPNGYMGLPGLILELEYDKTKLVAKEIQFFKEDIKIDFPKNKEVTEEEYLRKISIK